LALGGAAWPGRVALAPRPSQHGHSAWEACTVPSPKLLLKCRFVLEPWSRTSISTSPAPANSSRSRNSCSGPGASWQKPSSCGGADQGPISRARSARSARAARPSPSRPSPSLTALCCRSHESRHRPATPPARSPLSRHRNRARYKARTLLMPGCELCTSAHRRWVGNAPWAGNEFFIVSGPMQLQP
jgi:hypothetical protein